MRLQESEQAEFLRSLLIGLIVFMIIHVVLRIFYPVDPFVMILNAVFLIFFVVLYFFYQKSQKSELVSHLLLSGAYIILVIDVVKSSNSDFMLVWLLTIPLFSHLLLTPRQALRYSLLVITTMVMFYLIYPDSMTFDEKYRTLAVTLLIVGTLAILAKSRMKAWDEVQKHVEGLEERVEEALQQEREQKKLLIQTSKLATLGELLSSIAHQWKQPLSSISIINMKLRLMEELSSQPDEERMSMIKRLEKQVEFMTTTMRDFRTFFKAKDEKKTFVLNSATEQMTELLAENFKAHNIGINIKNAEADDIVVFGYENMYKQALLNLVVNAKDAIEKSASSDKGIDITFSQDETRGVVTVQDYAGRMPKTIMERVFEKGFTTKGEHGSGIGLAMSKEIIEDFCDGLLAVENTGEGTKFSIYIPLAEQDPHA